MKSNQRVNLAQKEIGTNFYISYEILEDYGSALDCYSNLGGRYKTYRIRVIKCVREAHV